MRTLTSISLAVALTVATIALSGVSPAIAKKGRDDAKSEVGRELDDRNRSGGSNSGSGGGGNSGSSCNSDGGGSTTSGKNGKLGDIAGYDRENGSRNQSSLGAAAPGASVVVSKGPRDELDRF